MLISHAHVETAAGARYRKQLASHLGRKNEIREYDDRWDLVFPYGRCSMQVQSGTGLLTLVASAATSEDLEHVQRVMGNHLERFGRHDDLSVTWRGDPMSNSG
ncbi:DUF2218 domain-containing protein [Egicoccus halophilus]|uniref:DUF2218 domain-containing protein n=1 Tax=Egicoccus halophilus TaxID=1670830 RepID=A0A8J3A4N5_9ACTN|nr:hypothetical protein GCM10011354_00510 [Egicoccus halophilus]